MDIKEYLNQIQRYEKVINNKLEEIEHLKSLATSISASAYGIERVQTSGSQDKIGDTIAKLVDAQRELADRKIAESLTPELIEKQKIDKWNGEVPKIQGSNTSTIVDTRDMTADENAE